MCCFFTQLATLPMLRKFAVMPLFNPFFSNQLHVMWRSHSDSRNCLLFFSYLSGRRLMSLLPLNCIGWFWTLNFTAVVWAVSSLSSNERLLPPYVHLSFSVSFSLSLSFRLQRRCRVKLSDKVSVCCWAWEAVVPCWMMRIWGEAASRAAWSESVKEDTVAGSGGRPGEEVSGWVPL